MRSAGRTGRPRAVVTGGAGFVGSHLVDRLIEENHDVLVIDDLSSGQEEYLPPAARVERVDIATGDLDSLLRSFGPATVYHLAAQASVPASMADPLRDLAVNVVGTHRVAAAARIGGSDRIVFVSSGGAVYGETKRAATERSLPAPASYYGIHKLAAEGHVAQAGLSFAIARPSNIYGPRQSAGLEGAVVASFLAQAAADGTLRIHGDGRQTRDLVHVGDVVDGLRILARPEIGSGVWNIGTGTAVTIGRLADLVEVACECPLGRVFGPRRSGDVADSNISSRRLRGLGWRSTITLPDGIRGVVQLARWTTAQP
jgi:UDP-glucose 4-epimerase